MICMYSYTCTSLDRPCSLVPLSVTVTPAAGRFPTPPPTPFPSPHFHTFTHPCPIYAQPEARRIRTIYVPLMIWTFLLTQSGLEPTPYHFITKTYLYNFDPLKPHFYIVKLGFTGLYIIFLISGEAVLTSTHNLCFVQKYEKISEFFLSENFQFLEIKFSIYLNRRVFVMCKSRALTTRPTKVHQRRDLVFKCIVFIQNCRSFKQWNGL